MHLPELNQPSVGTVLPYILGFDCLLDWTMSLGSVPCYWMPRFVRLNNQSQLLASLIRKY